MVKNVFLSVFADVVITKKYEHDLSGIVWNKFHI